MGKIVYGNSWIIDILIIKVNVKEVVVVGCLWWKIENEIFNILKN